jgi:hypothetical protein
LFQVSVLFTSSFLSRHSLPPFLSACQLLFKKFNHCLGCLQSILSFCLSAIHFVLFALLHCFYCFFSNFQSCPKMLFVPRILIKLFVSLEKNCLTICDTSSFKITFPHFPHSFYLSCLKKMQLNNTLGWQGREKNPKT